MKTKLIEALKKTIDDLKFNRKKYQWGDTENCNCGILAQNICNVSPERILELRNASSFNSWGILCHQTNRPIAEIILKMKEAGLTEKDFHEFETLSNPKILQASGIASGQQHYKFKENVILYMEAWLRILEREQPAPEPEYRTVVIDSKVKELTKQEIFQS